MFARSASFLTSRGVNQYSTAALGRRGNIFTLTLTGDGEDSHFLTPDLLKCLRSKLHEVKSEASNTNGSVLITTAEGKNFCRGFDVRCAGAAHYQDKMIKPFRELVIDLISLPMPTIAAINGYATSAGLILAMSHDFLTMESDRFLLNMIEMDYKMPLPDYFAAMIRSKVVPGGSARLALRALPFKSKDAREIGLAVEKSDKKPLDTAVQVAEELSRKGWDGKVYAEIRKALYPDLCNVLGLSCAPLLPSRL